MTVHHQPAGLSDSRSAVIGRAAAGAASEMVACSELMRLGFYVYRCESPHAPFDLVAYRNGQCLRVEVKTITFPEREAPNFKPPVNDEWDLLVVVGRKSDVFIFESGTSATDARDAIRGHYGFPRLSPPKQISCGTESGYYAHHRRKEPVCSPCMGAARAKNRERRQEASA